jgi:PAS domain-containing protein
MGRIGRLGPREGGALPAGPSWPIQALLGVTVPVAAAVSLWAIGVQDSLVQPGPLLLAVVVVLGTLVGPRCAAIAGGTATVCVAVALAPQLRAPDGSSPDDRVVSWVLSTGLFALAGALVVTATQLLHRSRHDARAGHVLAGRQAAEARRAQRSAERSATWAAGLGDLGRSLAAAADFDDVVARLLDAWPAWPDTTGVAVVTRRPAGGRALRGRRGAVDVSGVMTQGSVVPDRSATVVLPLHDLHDTVVGWLAVGIVRHAPDTTRRTTFLVSVAGMVDQALGRLELVHGRERLHLAGVLDAMVDGVAVVEPTGGDFRFTYVNRAHDPSVRAGDLVGRTIRQVFDPRTAQRVLATCRLAHLTGEPAVADPLHVDGEIAGRPVVASFTLHTTRVGTGVVLTWRDVTSREQAAEALRRSQADLVQAQRIARLGSWTLDPATDALRCSHEMSSLLGRPAGGGPRTWDALGAVVEIDGAPVVLDAGLLVELAHGGGSLVVDHTVQTVTGERLQVISYATVEGDHDRTVLRGTTQDLTELRRTQRALAATRRLLVHEQAAVEALQRAALPADLPRVDGVRLEACYMPAALEDRVGGDWYDALVLDGEVGLVVGDVVGHGLPSATLMAELRNAVRAYLLEHRDPAGALAQANEFVQALDGFATCACLVVDPATGTLRGATAGHPPPLVGPPGGLAPWWLRPGPMLGAASAARYAISETVVPSDGRLVLYTDGVIERRGEQVDAGVARLVAALGARSSTSPDWEGIVRSTAGEPRADDACLLVATRSPVRAHQSTAV